MSARSNSYAWSALGLVGYAAWVAFGTASYYLDVVTRRLRLGRQHHSRGPVTKTGRVVSERVRPEVVDSPPDVHYLRYPGLFGHSLWRSQELSLFRRHRNALPEPRLDFGCGDGSFAAALFGSVRCGIDSDEEALKTALAFCTYDLVVRGDGSRLPFEPATFQSIFANSVLEHTDDPQAVLAELNRALVVGGCVAFTVPTTGYTACIDKHFGSRESQFINRRLDHKHLHEPDWWCAVVEDAGFSVEVTHAHAPGWFTFTYLVMATGLVSRALGWGLGGTRFYQRLAPRLVRASIKETAEGAANLFILARRTGHGRATDSRRAVE